MPQRRAEVEGFVAGVRWAALHMVEAAGRMQNAGAAVHLVEAAKELEAEGMIRADKLWPPFD